MGGRGIGRKGRKGRQGRRTTREGRAPPQISSSLSNELISKLAGISTSESSESSGEEDTYNTFNSDTESSVKSERNVSIQASLTSNTTTDSISIAQDSPSSSKTDASEWSGFVDLTTTPKEQSPPKILAKVNKSNSKTFVAELQDALHDKEVRKIYSEVLLEPILSRLRDLEIQQGKLEKKVHKLDSKNKVLEENNKALEKKLAKLEKHMETAKNNKPDNIDSLKPIEKEITNMKHKANINMRMNDQDRRNNLVIIGIKENVNETQEEVDDKIKEILQKASIKLEGSFTASRLGKQNIVEKEVESPGLISRWMGNKAQKNKQDVVPRPRPVKISLTNQYDKHIIYKARITMKDTNNTGIFINEDLPKIQQTLLMHCRNARRQNKLISQWTEDGVVHIRTKDKDDVIVTDLQFPKNETCYKEQ